jgi:FKBP-type peptidyl-prolyl cis-trans isomerase FkpA
MKKAILFQLILIGLTSTSFAQKANNNNVGFAVNNVTVVKEENGWKHLSNGFQLKYWKQSKDTTKTEMGDFLEIHSITRVGDSVLVNSRLSPNKKPIEVRVVPPQLEQYDYMDVFKMLKKGDSVTIRMPLDTFLSKADPQLRLPWMKAGMMLDQDVTVVNHKSQADGFKEKETAAKKAHERDNKILKDYFAANKLTPKALKSGIYKQTIKNGSGDSIREGDRVTINYTGKVLNGKTFDSNIDPKFNHVEPFVIELGGENVLPGLALSLESMQKGSKAIFYIPSPLAYGQNSPGPEIPENSIIIFEIEVTKVEKGVVKLGEQ